MSNFTTREIIDATLPAIAAHAAAAHGVPADRLTSRAADHATCRVRRHAVALARHVTRQSLREIGAYFGGRSIGSTWRMIQDHRAGLTPDDERSFVQEVIAMKLGVKA